MTPTLVLSRAQTASQALAKTIMAQWGHDLSIVICPAIQISFIDKVDLPKAAHLIFTSVNGVNWARSRGLSAPDIWCVGDQTAEAAMGMGRIHNAQGRAADLVALIDRAGPSEPMLHLVGEHQHGDLAADLAALGYSCEARVVYRQSLNAPSADLVRALGGTRPLIAPVYSARSALLFGGLARQASLHGVAISSHVADVLVDLTFDTVTTAPLPSAASMVTTTLNVLRRVKERLI